ncbi:MAG: ATP synthase subunit I [Lachnospiraceae bacterium]|nr:ATP synthase subunit I [Lachnospiraceae bacterium]
MKQQKGLLERLRQINRTVLEMELGILFLAILFQLVSLPFPGERLARALSLLLGCVMAFAAVLHMYRILDRALDLDAESAQKAIYQGYVIRYLAAVIVILGTILTKWLNPLLVFLGIMTLKITAYLQPLTHKLCNKVFHETDPVELPLDEPSDGEQESTSEELAESDDEG